MVEIMHQICSEICIIKLFLECSIIDVAHVCVKLEI